MYAKVAGALQQRERERGSALAESVVVLGLLVLLVFGVIQYVIDEHGEQAAQAAASLALATARAQNGTAAQGQTAAQQLLSGLTGAIHDTTITVLSFIAIFIAGINIFGGFPVTRRMLRMFTRS